MARLFIKKLPRYECLLEAAQKFPDLNPSAMEAHLYLLKAGTDCMDFGQEYLASHGVSSGRFTVLMLLLKKQAFCDNSATVTPAELADMAGCTRATMTGLVDTLERDHLVKRVPDEKDRRMMAVGLTPKGIALLQKMLPEHFRRISEVMSCLNETERKTLVRLLEKIVDKIGSMGVPATP